MCTRYVITDPAEAIREWFETTGPLPNWPPNYNVAPTHIMPVIRPIDGGPLGRAINAGPSIM
jgi:putative SOS response-associated peptidase YedK